MIALIWNDELIFWHHPKNDKYKCKGWSCDHFYIADWIPGNSCHRLNSCKFEKTTRKAVENPRGISGHFTVSSSQRIGKYYGGDW